MRLKADFNGLFGDVLCLSHSDTAVDEKGTNVVLESGIFITVFDEDLDRNGSRDDLIASGTVEPSPDWLQCKGSRWVLKIDQHGVRRESDLRSSKET
jgi:hypothetical protein